MIQINLLPDIKRELIKTKRARSIVILGAIILGSVAIGTVILLAFSHFVVQAAIAQNLNSEISEKAKKLRDVKDIDSLLTLQSQLNTIQEKHDIKTATSRIFSLISEIIPVDPNNVVISNISLNSTEGTIRIEAQASNGFVAADIFKKTIAAVTYQYSLDGKQIEKKQVASNVIVSDYSYGEDANGSKVLRFTANFAYDKNLFAWNVRNVAVGKLDREDVTDSRQYLPKTLFGDRVDKVGGAQ